jgi:hypothetical protein
MTHLELKFISRKTKRPLVVQDRSHTRLLVGYSALVARGELVMVLEVELELVIEQVVKRLSSILLSNSRRSMHRILSRRSNLHLPTGTYGRVSRCLSVGQQQSLERAELEPL